MWFLVYTPRLDFSQGIKFWAQFLEGPVKLNQLINIDIRHFYVKTYLVLFAF